MYDKNCLSYWFPKIRDAGLPVPKTEIVMMTSACAEAVWEVFDGKLTGEGSRPFFDDLTRAVEKVGLPAFLRTGQGSGKHDWKNCCCLTDIGKIEEHVVNLINWSETVNFMGLPSNVWAVREFLSTIPQMVADRYGDMPVCREFRFFVDGDNIRCWHPYWPKDALICGLTTLPEDFDWRYDCLCNMPAMDANYLYNLASSAGKAVGGSWSVDILETKYGWYITDMAVAEMSYHWPDCPNADC